MSRADHRWPRNQLRQPAQTYLTPAIAARIAAARAAREAAERQAKEQRDGVGQHEEMRDA